MIQALQTMVPSAIPFAAAEPSLTRAASHFGKDFLGGSAVFTAAGAWGLGMAEPSGSAMAIAAGLGTCAWGAARSISGRGDLLTYSLDVAEAAAVAYWGSVIGYSLGENCTRDVRHNLQVFASTVGAVSLGATAGAVWLVLCVRV